MPVRKFTKEDRAKGVTSGDMIEGRIDLGDELPPTLDARASEWANPEGMVDRLVTEEMALHFWNAMQEDGKNFDFESCWQRLDDFSSKVIDEFVRKARAKIGLEP